MADRRYVFNQRLTCMFFASSSAGPKTVLSFITAHAGGYSVNAKSIWKFFLWFHLNFQTMQKILYKTSSRHGGPAGSTATSQFQCPELEFPVFSPYHCGFPHEFLCFLPISKNILVGRLGTLNCPKVWIRFWMHVNGVLRWIGISMHSRSKYN